MTSINFQKCARCHAVSYCSKQCQEADWRSRHKRLCMPVIVKEMGAKGRGLVATKDMEMGTLIVKEKAAVKVRKGFQAAMGDEAFGREIERQMSNLSKEEQEEFSKLTKNKKIMLDPFVPKKYKEIIAIFENNSILSTENESDVFSTVSLLNHSCVPNAAWDPLQSRYLTI